MFNFVTLAGLRMKTDEFGRNRRKVLYLLRGFFFWLEVSISNFGALSYSFVALLSESSYMLLYFPSKSQSWGKRGWIF